MSYRSHEILQGPGYANVRALYKADGYAEEELKRPIIGIANAYNSICPGHIVLRQMAERIREGIQAAGGMPIEFGTIGACDGIAMGHEGMRYILPAREMIANDVEAMVQAHRLDGIVLLGSCDKIIPGMLIGAMRVNLPAIFINGGPSLPGHMADGNPYGGEWIDHSCIQQSEGALQAEKITEKEFKWIEDNAMPTVGSCAMLGTANTMGCTGDNNISEDAFMMSKKLGKPVIMLAQANREAVKNKKKGQSPELHDLAESDGVAQNATRVISLSVIDGILKLSTKKNRYGINNKDVMVMWEINAGYIKPLLENKEGEKGEAEDYGF